MLRNKLEKFRLELSAQKGSEITQLEFSKILGIGQSQYNRYANQLAQPSLEVAFKLAKKLNCKIEELFDGTPD